MTQENCDKKNILIVAGPTASGKSARAIELALERNGVIVNCDSLQIYNGLPILTAQPTQKDFETAPHRLYSYLHPNESCSAGNWRELVEPILYEIINEGKIPIITGGSGLYIKALTEGLSPIPDVPQDIRDKSVELQKLLGNPNFHSELAKRDPEMANKLHPYHTARLVRAWEVFETTGKSLNEWQQKKRLSPPENWRFEIEVLIPERTVLHQRCNERLIQMLKNGVLDEIEEFNKKIQDSYIRPNVPLLKALGYKPLLEYIQGKKSKNSALEEAQAKTRQYAKQQVTWFRHQLR